MKVIETGIEGLKVIELKVHGDARGFFVERFRSDVLGQSGIPVSEFVQDNHSRSKPGTLRGLHYQTDPAQGKLVGVTRGSVFDVAVDIRHDSKTFGKWFGIELSDMNGRMLWMPSGFAHGFCVIGNEPADFLYKVTGFYNPKTEGGIRYNDLDFGVKWPTLNVEISARDQQLQSFADYRKNPLF